MINFQASKLQVIFADGGLVELAEFVKRNPNNWRNKSSVNNSATNSWDLAVGWRGAQQMAETGWSDGARNFDQQLNALPPNEAEPEYFYDVAGYMPDVPLYCSGEPMHMINHGHPEGRRPVIHIVVNAVAAAMIGAQEYANYGMALTAMVGQIEATGRQVELDVVFVTSLRGGKAVLGWKVKRAGDNVDLSAVAYSIGHPAAFRRLGFALIERTQSTWETSGHGFCAGMTENLAEHINAKGAFLLGGVGVSSGSCKTMLGALKFAAMQINKAAGEQLVTVNE